MCYDLQHHLTAILTFDLAEEVAARTGVQESLAPYLAAAQRCLASDGTLEVTQ